MAYNDIVNSRIDTDSPLTQDLLTDLRDNPIGIANGDAGAPKIQTAAYDAGSVNSAAIGANAVGQSEIASGAVHQSELDTSTGEVSRSSSSGAHLILPGGAYGFYPQTRATGVGGDAQISFGLTNTVYSTNIWLKATTTGPTIFARQRYINSSAPYDLGDGVVPFFVFAEMDTSGSVVSLYCADVPPWVYNGPTDVTGKPYKLQNGAIKYGRMIRPRQRKARREGESIKDLLVAGRLSRESFLDEKPEFEEITPQDKNADMRLIPHPFLDPEGSVVLLDPMSDDQHLFAKLQSAGEDVADIFRNYMHIDNVSNQRKSSPGVMPVNFRWKNTGRRNG